MFDPKKYPANWKTEIRPRILARAGNRCETCGVLNGAIGYRKADGSFVQLAEDIESAGMEVEVASCVDERKVIRIVCTVAHILPDTMDCRDSNLILECQRCHNRRDGAMRQANAAATRSRKREASMTARGVLALAF
ncbi:MAG: hypothetical protein V4671_19390 [Armatimonadota bacterium]